MRPLSSWNDAKTEEFTDRVLYKIGEHDNNNEE